MADHPTSPTFDQDQELRSMLSLKSRIPPDPTDGQTLKEGQSSFRKIGAGACGAIFAQDGKSLVFKLAKSPDPTELWNDYQMHQKIAQAFKRHSNIGDVTVPECHFFVPGDRKSFWNKNPKVLDAAKDVCNLPTAALVSERITPFPSATRKLLIDKYCPAKARDAAYSDDANKDCLVRLYLGSNTGRTTGGMFFSLRNYKLHLNHMVSLGLDTEALARRMGCALGVLHWGAKTDARDVEFVLGCSTKKLNPATARATTKSASDPPFTYTGPPTDEVDDFFCRETKVDDCFCPETKLFVLDFNQVRTITMDDDGVKTAVEAWKVNDPYYPKPLGETEAERKVWNFFRRSYLDASYVVMKAHGLEGDEVYQNLPSKFILGITKVTEERLSRA
ncbi:zinc finger protein-domain-containing protein [Podospora conica]|nr:zinc finger protein-domain-containing protein [Schizothecium conicum]